MIRVVIDTGDTVITVQETRGYQPDVFDDLLNKAVAAAQRDRANIAALDQLIEGD